MTYDVFGETLHLAQLIKINHTKFHRKQMNKMCRWRHWTPLLGQLLTQVSNLLKTDFHSLQNPTGRPRL